MYEADVAIIARHSSPLRTPASGSSNKTPSEGAPPISSGLKYAQAAAAGVATSSSQDNAAKPSSKADEKSKLVH